MWQVYILQCADGSFYTGIAKDMKKRIATHNAGRGAKYTKSRCPVKLVYDEPAVSRSAAQKREYAIKCLSRFDKENLVRAGQ